MSPEKINLLAFCLLGMGILLSTQIERSMPLTE